MPDKMPHNNAPASTLSCVMPATQAESSNSHQSNTSIIASLFLLMAECYGGRWTSQYQMDEESTVRSLKSWSNILSGLTNKQISQAASAMVDRYPSYPPTVGEFKALAREYEDFTPEYFTAKPYTPPTPEVKRHVADMMRKLKADLEAGQP